MNIQLNAEQLLFSRIEAQYSAKRKSGYQVVYATPSLNPQDITTIERRVQCFEYPRDLPRFQYFHLETGKAVLVKSTPIIEVDPEITDRNKRGGAFIAHALILSHNDFSQIHHDPFLIFNHSSLFVSDARTMVDRFVTNAPQGPQPLNIPSVRNLQNLTRWTDEALANLMQAAFFAQSLVQQGMTFYFQSDQDQDQAHELFTLFAGIFYVLKSQERLACTFDTFIDGCNPQPGVYWATGGIKRVMVSKFKTINMGAYTVGADILNGLSQAAPQDSFYLAWWNYAIRKSGVQAAMYQAPSAQAVMKSLETRQPLTPPSHGNLDMAVVKDFWDANATYFSEKLQGIFVALIGKNVGPFFAEQLLSASLMPIQDLLNGTLLEQFELLNLATVLRDWVITNRPEFKENQWKEIRNFAETAGEPYLMFIGAVWSGKDNSRVREDALIRIHQIKQTPHLLNAFFATAANPSDCVIAENVQFVLHFAATSQRPMSDAQFADLVVTALDYNEGDYLGYLVQRVDQMRDPQAVGEMVKRIDKETRRGMHIHRNFLEAVARIRMVYGL